MTRDELIEAMARALCGAWEYVWDGDPSDDQTAPETDQPYDDRPSKALFRLGANEALAALEAARPDIAAVLRGEGVVVPLKLMRETHACMRETGWHRAVDYQKSDDGVIEAAVSQIEERFAAMIATGEKEMNHAQDR